MEFTISRDELQSALYLMQGVVERRTTVPVLAHVLLTADGDGVVIAATDQQMGVRKRCQARVKKKGSATANGRMLYEIGRELPPGDVTLRELDNHWIEIASGKSRFKVVGIDPQEFPVMPKMPREPDKQALSIPAGTLSEMVTRTLFAVSSDETRVNLSGVFLEAVTPGRVRMVATDGHRLAMVTRDVENAAQAAGFILPRKGIVELKRLLESGEDEGELLTLVRKATAVHAARGSVELAMRLVEGEFPDYKQVVPPAPSRKISVDVDAFQAALRRVSLVSSELSHGVRLGCAPGRMKLSSMNPDRGEAEEEVDAEFGGEPVEVGFNARYLLDVLAVLPPTSRVEIGLGDELSPGMFQCTDDPDYIYVVMPMRL
jgi:DNA polymerase-3 subunit beta